MGTLTLESVTYHGIDSEKKKQEGVAMFYIVSNLSFVYNSNLRSLSL